MYKAQPPHALCLEIHGHTSDQCSKMPNRAGCWGDWVTALFVPCSCSELSAAHCTPTEQVSEVPQQPSVGSKLLALWLSLFWIYDTVTNSGPHGSRCFKLETKGYLFSVFSQTMTVNLNVYFLQLIYCVLRLLPTAPRSFTICFELPQLDFLSLYINA